MLSWRLGAVECRVVAAAGSFVLLRPEHTSPEVPTGSGSLTYLEGMVPMGWDGSVEAGARTGELRFRVGDPDTPADRRTSVRIPVSGAVSVHTGETALEGDLLDVSAGGLRVRHRGRIPIDTRARVRVALAADLLLDADGVVRGSEPGVTAVEFTAMHGAPAALVGAWVVDVLRASLAGQG